MKRRHRTRSLLAACLAMGAAMTTGVTAQQISNDVFQTNVTIQVLPYAELEFTGGNLLYLRVPPPDSTIPNAGVTFVVRGNAMATMTAEPDDFIYVPGEGYMGRAVLGSGETGYKLELRFPSGGVGGSYPQYAGLPLSEMGATVPPLTVNLRQTAGERVGVIHMEASEDWTADGSLPLPGIYEGHVILTVTADNV